MRFVPRSISWLPLLAAGALVWPSLASAQVDYELAGRVSPFGGAGFLIQPYIQAETRHTGVGLSIEAGRNWFAQVGVGRSLQYPTGLMDRGSSGDVVNLAGGYRWSGGQSLSLQLHRARGDRLGLAVSYGWPRYFVRLSYDSGLSPVPQDSLRFSAGVRF